MNNEGRKPIHALRNGCKSELRREMYKHRHDAILDVVSDVLTSMEWYGMVCVFGVPKNDWFCARHARTQAFSGQRQVEIYVSYQQKLVGC